jgi:hypothetical protein
MRRLPWTTRGCLAIAAVGLLLAFLPSSPFRGTDLLVAGTFGAAVSWVGIRGGIDRLAFAVAAAANVLILVVSSWMPFVPRGQYVRPMGWAMFVSVVGVGAVIAVAALVAVSFVQRRGPSAWSLAASVLAVVSVVLGPLLLHASSFVFGFHLAP